MKVGGTRHRPPRRDAADGVRREGRHANPRQGPGAAAPRGPRLPARDARAASRTAYRKPYGTILVTGPTGSGKSTTLYATLNLLNDARPQHHHGRGPGRVPAARHQPGADQPEGRADVRRPRCGRSCAPTPTSCSSVRSATARPRSSRSRPRSPVTSCSRRCTPTTPRRRRCGSSRWASSRSSSRARSTASSPNASPAGSATSARSRTSRPRPSCVEAGWPIEELERDDWPTLHRRDRLRVVRPHRLPGPVRAPRGDARDRGDRAADHRAPLDRGHPEGRRHAGHVHAARRRPAQGRHGPDLASRRSSGSSPERPRLRSSFAGFSGGGARRYRTGSPLPAPRGIRRCSPVRPVASARRSSTATCSRVTTSNTRLDEVASARKQPLPAVLLRLGLVGSKDLTAALAEQHGRPLRRLPRDAAPPGRARHCSPADVARAARRAAGRLRGPQARRRVRRAGRRRRASPRSAPRPATRSSRPSPTAPSSCSAIDMIYGRRRTGARAGSTAPRRRSTTAPSPTTSTSTICSTLVLQWRGSDLHLTVGLAAGHPRPRRPAPDAATSPILNGSQIRQMVYSILTQKQREKFENELELDTLVHAARQGPLPRERLPAARLGRLRDARDPVRDRRLRRARRAARR